MRPAGQTSPIVTFYSSSLDKLDRNQVNVAEKHAVVEGGDPKSDASGLEPGEILFHGFWLGTSAEQMAGRLRDEFIDDPTVTRVEIQAGDDTGSVSSPYNGTYVIAEPARITQPVSDEPELWEYRLQLIEDD